MRNYLFLTFAVIFYLFSTTQVKAQPGKQNPGEGRINNDGQKIHTPKGQLQNSTTKNVVTKPKDEGYKAATFEPKRKLSIVSEDTTTINEDITSVIQVSDFLKIDCVWVKAAEYYSIWSSRYINPYAFKAAEFRDTIQLKLYDDLRGQTWASPLKKLLVTSHFGPRWGRFHHGIDLNLKTGEPVHAMFDGIVRIATYGGGYGYHVVVRHYNGLETLHGHFSALKCEVGQVVKAGQVIGLGGSTGKSTGPHLHLEIRYAGNTINPMEICDFYDQEHLVREQYFYLKPSHFRHLGNRVRKEYIHIVKSGETLTQIAKKYGVSLGYLANLNRLSNRSDIKTGQRLRVK